MNQNVEPVQQTEKPKRIFRMLQPKKDELRQVIVDQEKEIIRLNNEIDRLRAPWWQKLFRRKA